MITAAVVIIGGGIVGSSVALHLRRDGVLGRVLVIERDPSYTRASSRLAMGGVRQQFGSRVNIRLAQYSAGFYRQFDDGMRVNDTRTPVNFRQRGYLFLVSSAMSSQFERRFARQRELGAHVERWDRDQIRARIPDVVLDDIEFGIFGPEDGYLDAPSALAGFRAAAADAGAEYVTADVTGIERAAGRVTGVTLGDGESVCAPFVVNAAGPYAARVATLAGLSLPVRPVRQQLFRCALPRRWPYRFPLVVDPVGLHWRHDDPPTARDPDRIILAWTKHDEVDADSFAVDMTRWREAFLPALLKRMPACAGVRSVEGWAGLYEMTPDHNPIIGEHPELAGFFLANGFSGHGLMLAPATGKAMSELIRLGHADTVDVTPFGIERFARGELLWDDALI